MIAALILLLCGPPPVFLVVHQKVQWKYYSHEVGPEIERGKR